MVDFILKIIDTSDFTRRWNCGNWTAGHAWLHIVSDIAIWGAYIAISCVLAYFILKRRQDVVFPWIFWLFGAFIFACGLVHLIEATVFWWPAYRLSGMIKLVTAALSWATVIALVRVMPEAMALPKLATVNAALQRNLDQLEQSQQLRARLAAIVESSDDAIIGKTLDGTITSWNRGAERMYGYSAEEVIGQNIALLFRPEDADDVPRLLERVAQGETIEPIHARRVRQDGRVIDVSLTISPIIDSQGRVSGASAIARDITRLKRADRELQRTNEELQQKNEEMEQFVYTVSHDLKSPLVTITGFLGILKEDATAGRVDELLDAVARIEGAADHMTELIEDLLQLSRIGHVADSINDVDMREVVRDIVSRLAKRLEKAGATLTVQSDLPHVLGDRPRLTEVVENLLTNAIKYGCQGTSPTVRIGATVENGETRIYVKDDGPGIAPQYHERIFGLFQRLDTRQEGTGVGLAIARRIVEAHGGRIWVESRPGEGATFWLVLPTQGAAQHVEPHTAVNDATGPTRT